MRKILTLALAAIVAVGVVSFATADESVQTETFKIKPGKLSKKKFSNVKYVNTIVTNNKADNNQPPKATRTVLDYSKNIKFNNKKFPTCKTDAAGLAAQPTPKDAKKACGKGTNVSTDVNAARTKGSYATIRIGTGVPDTPPAAEIPVDVVAFNGKNNTLFLYSKPTGDFSGIPATVLSGKLKKSKAGKKYGKALDVTISGIDAGAISEFVVTIPKSKYVQAKCKPKKFKIQATTTFSDAPKVSDTHTQKCKPKK